MTTTVLTTVLSAIYNILKQSNGVKNVTERSGLGHKPIWEAETINEYDFD